ncbi:hypothetical protein D3C71_1185440 [compost metagenome]
MAVEALQAGVHRQILAVAPQPVAPAGRLIRHVTSKHGQEAIQCIARRLRHVADQIQVAAIGGRRSAKLELVASVVEVDFGIGRRNLGLLAAEEVAEQCAEDKAHEGADAGRNEIAKQPSRIT